MDQIWLILIGIAVVVTAGFAISLILELKKAVRSLNDLLKTTEQSLKPTLEELQQTLSGLKNISNNLEDVTSDIKTLSGSIRDVGLNVRHVTGLIGDVASTVSIKTSGMKAGVKTGLMVLLNNMCSRKGGEK